ncbi:MAG: hypothetical protein K2M65_01640 [Muribaculaceae bacterium]|nr:hypothetical protein [Muribaculaceae bacterium]
MIKFDWYAKLDKLHKNKKGLITKLLFVGFPIGTISKVKKIALGLRYKGGPFY